MPFYCPYSKQNIGENYPNFEAVKKITQILNVSFDYLVDNTGVKTLVNVLVKQLEKVKSHNLIEKDIKVDTYSTLNKLKLPNTTQKEQYVIIKLRTLKAGIEKLENILI